MSRKFVREKLKALQQVFLHMCCSLVCSMLFMSFLSCACLAWIVPLLRTRCVRASNVLRPCSERIARKHGMRCACRLHEVGISGKCMWHFQLKNMMERGCYHEKMSRCMEGWHKICNFVLYFELRIIFST